MEDGGPTRLSRQHSEGFQHHQTSQLRARLDIQVSLYSLLVSYLLPATHQEINILMPHIVQHFFFFLVSCSGI